MPINRKLLKGLALGLGTTGLAGGAGYLGHKIGYHYGAKRMANAMEYDINKVRSQAYNSGVNDAMANVNNTFNAMMSKVSEAAFKDEFEKLSGIVGGIFGTAKETGKELGIRTLKKFHPSHIGKSYKNLSQSVDNLGNAYHKEKLTPGSGKEDVKNFIESLKKSKMALATTGAGIATAGYGYHKLVHKKPSPYLYQ
jgi:hypothetical protein